MPEPRIIKDARVLKEHFIPKRIQHREGQLQAIRDNVKPVLEERGPRDMLLYGPPGTGKTCLARFVLDELSKKASKVKTSYVNFFENSSRFRILYEVVTDLGSPLSAHEKGTPTDEVLGKLRKLVEGEHRILILDEVNKLREKDVLYSLARTPEIALIFISNRESVLWDVDSRIRSSLAGMRNIEFSEYSTEELKDILQDRVKWGLTPNSIRKEQLERVAMLAEGDARLAIDSLRVVTKRSEEGDLDAIQNEYIEDAVSTARGEIDSKTMERLNEIQMTLFEILKENGETGAGDLHETYKEKAENPVVRRTVRKYLDKLERLGLIEAEGKGRWRMYRFKRSGS